MKVNSDEYKGHAVFESLDILIDYYDWWSIAIMSFSSMGTKSIVNIDTYVYSSNREHCSLLN